VADVRAGERAELEAFRDFFAAGRMPTREAGGAIALRPPGPATRELTRILGLYDAAALDSLDPFFDGAAYWVSLDPEAGIDDELEARGFEPDYPWQKFERGVEPFEARTDLRIGAADERFGSVFVAAYGLDPAGASWVASVHRREGWHAFAAYDGEEPVATGALFVTGDVGWFGLGATLPRARGRGAQSAILAARIDRASELGLTQLVTETGTPRDGRRGSSYRNILRAGFEPSYVRPNYRSPANPTA
jgi:GNAT superfamily N-acetyltransferase